MTPGPAVGRGPDICTTSPSRRHRSRLARGTVLAVPGVDSSGAVVVFRQARDAFDGADLTWPVRPVLEVRFLVDLDVGDPRC